MKLFTYIITVILFSPLLLPAQQSGSWALVGPNVFPTNISGQIHGIGRVCQVKFHPSDSMKMYAVSASGGLWISDDNANTWHVSGTDQLPPTACASVCIDFTNDSIIYLSTGDPNYYGNDYGIYKSTDGGSTWQPSNNNIGYRMALEMLMDPADHNIVIAATNDGIWKTYDGGANWSIKKSGGDFKDMKMKPAPTSQVLYAVTSSEFYRSDDMGETWTKVTNGTAVPGGGSGEGFRIAVSPADTQVVYVGMVKDEGTIIKSTDGGYTFTTVYHNPSQSLTGYDSGGGGQGNYNYFIAADPDDADVVYSASHVVWKSTDGGVSWLQLTQWWAVLHTDMHYIGVNPYNHQQLFNANDGGVWVSIDGGTGWTPKSDGLGATEIYHASSSPVRKDLISIGTQDNGELYYSGNTWKCNRGGDWGSRSIFDFTNNDKVYYYENGKRRNLILNGGETSYNLPIPAVNKNVFAFNPLELNTAFVAEDSVYRTINVGNGSPSWTLIKSLPGLAKAICSAPFNPNVLYVATDNDKFLRCENALGAVPVFVTITTPASTGNGASIAALQSDTNVVYLSCGSKVFRSDDRGDNWTDVTFNLPGVNIKAIYADNYVTDESIYIGSAVGVYYRNNTMSSWLNYSLGLPDIANITDFMLYNDGTAASVLRVSYYGRGVWESELNKSLAPVAAFTASETFFCPGTTIQFTDQSYGNPVSWSWVFQGGNPATSTQQNPTVSYAVPGTYTVTLTATNAVGANTFTQTAYITVAGTQSLPLAEDFESIPFPSVNWHVEDAANDNVAWMRNTTKGGYGLSFACMYFDNFNHDVSGTRDEVWTPKYNLQNVTNPWLKFDVAYARYDSYYSDTLAVLVSTDCGATFTTIYIKGGTALATAPDVTSGTFSPDSSQWRTDSIDMSAWTGQTDLFIAFQNMAHYGQALYIDNINLTGTSGAAPVASFTANNLSICAGENISFFDQSGGLATSWQWYFPGASPATSITQNPIINYPNSGIYDVALVSTNSFGSDSIYQAGFITVNALPPAPVISFNSGTLSCSPSLTYQWYFAGVAIPGATAQNYFPNQSGNYLCIVGDSNSCGATSNIINVVINGESYLDADHSFKLFPDPNNGSFNMEFHGDFLSGSFEIYNTLGEKVFHSEIGNEQRMQISIADARPGIYLVRLRNNNNYFTKRFLVY